MLTASAVVVHPHEHDQARLMNGVTYVDNEVNLQSTSLPVPEAAADVATSP